MLELLETEQAYVARLHLLDQASWDSSTRTISGMPTPAQDIIGWLWGSIRTEPLSASCIANGPGQPYIWQPHLASPLVALYFSQGLGRHR